MTNEERMDAVMLQLAERANSKLKRSPRLRRDLGMRPSTEAEMAPLRRKVARARKSS